MAHHVLRRPASIALFAALAAASNPIPAQADPTDLPYGPDTCIQGYVWREARSGDTVCVTPEVRARTAQENATAADRREPNGGAYGPNTCIQGFVWREAFDGDVVCVTPDVRTQTRADNAAAASRKQANAPKNDPSGPNFVIWVAPDCSVVLDGAGPGRDTLNVGYQVQNLGPGTVDKLVPVRVSLDSGASVNYNSSLGGGPDGRAQNYAQMTVDSSFYQRDNRVTITADPDNQYAERVESDNSAAVLIPRQPRPANSMIDLKCQAV
ncbi:hypothetical protein [Mycobacterium sp. 852013-50091_SCH5140682]|uniref:hypothetical protein n=1 Tax=Mycobacterium sp. 852013-50091_SCH5140682 TaxID=1834109 RepID=UPI000AEB92AA|nr:hypothetical protein [Mycobacterium sp. 852013-50091_SCH5140682]